ncbi:MAG: shikimate kinase [Gemmatimonadaceae bacterium]
MVKHVVLVGLPGVGKSTVGRAVAGKLGRPFVDLDVQIERSFGKSVSRIFGEDGEATFRNAEVEVTALVAETSPAVIAPGGGWVLNSLATAHLRDRGRIIYLRVSPDGAVQRMGRGIARRPLLRAAPDPRETLRLMYEFRRPLYEGCSEITVETSGVGRSNVIAMVVERVLAAERGIATEND